jgi:peptide/nickel transport system permease protein
VKPPALKAIRRLLSHREILLGLLIVGCFAVIAAAAPVLAPESWISMEQEGLGLPDHSRIAGSRRDHLPLPPGPQAILGTTGRQVDVYYSLVWGTRDAFEFGLPVALGAALLGTMLGAFSGLAGGWLNWLLTRLTDGFLTFPIIAGVVLSNELRRVLFYQSAGEMAFRMTDVFSMRGFSPVLEILLSPQVVFILLIWMPYARLVNGLVLRNKSSEYVLAAQMAGASSGRIVTRHLIPNIIAPIIVLFSRDIGAVVLLQAALTFARFSSGSLWGGLLALGRDFVMGSGGNPLRFWWVFIPPSLMIILFGVGWSLLGDGLNDWLNPRSRYRVRL